MNFLQSSPQERLRPMVGIKGWDFCVFWKLGEDHRCLEWMGCCCCGAEFSVDPFSNLNNTGSSVLSCRDVLFPHPRTKTCDIISELPISIQLDSGIHAEAFLSSQPKWITFSDSTEESYKTRVLIPSLCGGWLVELFVSKHVSEDPQLIQFVSAQCNNDFCSGEQQQQPLLLVRNHTLHNFNFSPAQQEFPASPNINDCLERDSSTNFENSSLHRQEIISSSPPPIPNNNNLNHFNPWVSQTDNFRGQQFPALNKHDIFFEGSTDSVISDKPSLNIIDHGFQEIVALQQSLGESPHTSGGGNLPKELENDEDMIKQEMSRAESMSDCSDQMENDDDQKIVGRSGRKPQSKNLVAERRRRKKLNERLYALRALVPKITKMDRASILGDAIEYVTELQQQVKQFQDELEENHDEEGENQVTPLVKPNGDSHQNNNNDHEEYPNGLKIGIEQGARCSSSTKPSELLKQNKECDSIDDKAQQMEDQVEVNQGDGNEFNLKIFCERKAGGFVRLMQAMDFLGLEVIHVNITTYSCLVLNVFKAMIRDNEAIQPEQVRDSLLELTKNPNSWSEAKTEGGSSSANHHHNNYVHHLHHLNHH